MSENNSISGKVYLINKLDQSTNEIPSLQAAMHKIGQLALQSLTPEKFIDQSIDHIVNLITVDFFAVFKKSPHNDHLTLTAGRGWEPHLIGQAMISSKPDTQAGHTLCYERSLGFDEGFSMPDLLKKHDIKNGMTVVIPGKKQPYGMLGVYTKDQRKFSDPEMHLLGNFANYLALVLDREQAVLSFFTAQDERAILLDRITDGITLQAQSGQLLYVNENAVKLMGYKSQETLLETNIVDVMKKFLIFDDSGNIFPIERLPGHRVLQGETGISELIRFSEVETGLDRWFVVKASPVYNSLQQVEFAVNIYQDVTNIKQSEQDYSFLAQVTMVMTKSLDYSKLLNEIATMAVDYIADWCVFHLIDENGDIQQLATTHKDPEKIDLALELQEKYPPDPSFNRGVYQVMRTGQPEFFPKITDDGIRAITKTEEHLNLVRSLGFRSAMVLPMIARGNIMGAVSLVWGGKGGYYDERQIFLANELTRRAALAVDNVRLYHESNLLNVALETKVKRRTALLEKTIEKLNKEINERKIIEKNLIRSRALFSDLFTLSPDGVFLIDQKGVILRMNVRGQQIFGYEPEEMVGRSFNLLLPERYKERHKERHIHDHGAFDERSVQRTIEEKSELYGKRKSGERFPVDVMFSSIRVEDELLVISTVRDITDQQKMQIELEEVQHRLIDSQEKERLILSQELHDGIIQELFSIHFQLSEIKNDLQESGIDGFDEKLKMSSDMTQQVIQGLRNISRNLRPPALTPFGLEQAIYSHMEQFQEVHPELNVHLDLMPDGKLLDEDLRLVLYRIYQNAVSNVARHSQAANLFVYLKFDDKKLILEIKDDGQGIDFPIRWVDLARKGHLGLVGTRERVQAIGGKLTIQSVPGKGTLLRVDVPLT